MGPQQDWDAYRVDRCDLLTPWGVSGGQVGVKSYLSSDLSETWIIASLWGHNKIEMPNSLIGGDLLTLCGGQILFIIRFE